MVDDNKKFTLCFEGDEHNKKFELDLPWNGETTPDVVQVPFGGILVKVGRYATAGDRYWYRRAVVARLGLDGRIGGHALTPVINTFTVNPKGAA